MLDSCTLPTISSKKAIYKIVGNQRWIKYATVRTIIRGLQRRTAVKVGKRNSIKEQWYLFSLPKCQTFTCDNPLTSPNPIKMSFSLIYWDKLPHPINFHVSWKIYHQIVPKKSYNACAWECCQPVTGSCKLFGEDLGFTRYASVISDRVNRLSLKLLLGSQSQRSDWYKQSSSSLQ